MSTSYLDPKIGKHRTHIVQGPSLLRITTSVCPLDKLKSVRILFGYHALSYTWGPPDQTTPVELNGEVVQVSPNLEAALRQFLLNQKAKGAIVKWLWADALCIQQRNKAEKSWMVRLMREIYETAFRVQIWLGTADETDVKGLAALKMLAKDYEDATPNRNSSGLASDVERIALLKATSAKKLDVRAAVKILNKPWFDRVWIIQEFLVAQRATFHCGRSIIEGGDLSTAYVALYELGFASWNRILTGGPGLSGQPGLAEIVDTMNQGCVETVMMIRAASGKNTKTETSRSPQAPATTNPAKKLESFTGAWRLSLPEMVFQASVRGSKAVNPRDMIYPFLGLAADASLYGIQPNYAASVQEVYTNAAMAFLSNGKARILALCHQPKNMSHLPSWVPDWTMRLEGPLSSRSKDFKRGTGAAFSRKCLYAASDGEIGPKFEIYSGYPRELEISAVLFDEIKVLGTESPPLCESKNPNWAWKFLHTSLLVLRENMALHTRSLMKDWIYCGKLWLATSSSTALLRIQLIMTVKANLLIDANIVAAYYYGYVGWFTDNRRSFATKKGYIGFGPRHVREDDVVSIIIGLEAPMILRKIEKDRYEIVGEAYVHGIMDGEATNAEGVEVERIVLK
ncbi:hypothetical protein H2200_005399 [Cladophialophora chaetospira]|uniref:Heterokaryon incompatibility domain-containing protein n=1 Tax=Cladophialophora chaetospira TaxID=386627 RepID=A0AA39CJJ9_9EURO|nr:hypothetical protein H2200_005399 [Cladophialophora chaetospira]